MRRVLALVLCLAGCTSAPERYAVPDTDLSERVRIPYASVEVRDVSLPTYAAADEIHAEIETGALTSSTSVLWADAPARAMSLSLARDIAALTGALVANEPWPFQDFPTVRLEVRVEEMVARADGQFSLRGQYFVAPERGRRDRARRFDLSIPYALDGGPQAIAAARGQASAELARLITREGLR